MARVNWDKLVKEWSGWRGHPQYRQPVDVSWDEVRCELCGAVADGPECPSCHTQFVQEWRDEQGELG